MAAHVPSRLYRSRSQKMLAGVCGGLGEYFDVDPVLIRLLFVVTTFISGTGILAYIVLWIVVPFEGGDTSRMDTLKRDFGDLTGRVRDFMDPPRPDMPSAGPTGQGGPDVTGYHSDIGPGPYGPQGGTAPGAQTGAAGGSASATSPFTTSREASMSSESTSARVPGAETAPRPETTPPTAGTPTGSTATADRPGSTPTDDDLKAPGVTADVSTPVADTPLEIDPPAGPPSGAEPHKTAWGSGPAAAGASQGAAGPDPGAGAPFGQGPGTPPFGSSFGGPFGGPSGGPFGGPFSGPFGGAPGGQYGGAAGGQGWSQTSGPEPAGGAPFFGPPPTERRRRRQHWAGALLILIGLMILGNNLGLLWWIKMQYLMPLLLVGVGAWLLFGRGRRG